METKQDERPTKSKEPGISRFEMRPEDFVFINARVDRITELSAEGLKNSTLSIVSRNACRQCAGLAKDIRNILRNLIAVKEDAVDERKSGE